MFHEIFLEIRFSDSRTPDWNLFPLFDLPLHPSYQAICVCGILAQGPKKKGKPQITRIPQMIAGKAYRLAGAPFCMGQKRGRWKAMCDSLRISKSA